MRSIPVVLVILVLAALLAGSAIALVAENAYPWQVVKEALF